MIKIELNEIVKYEFGNGQNDAYSCLPTASPTFFMTTFSPFSFHIHYDE